MLAARVHPDADFIKGSHLVNKAGKESLTKFAERRRKYADRILGSEEALSGIVHGHNIPCNVLYKREFLNFHKIKFIEEMTYLEDGPFIMEVFANKPKALYVDYPTYVYRIQAEGSVTNSPMTYTKILSLITGAVKYQQLRGIFGAIGEAEREKQENNYAYTALWGASTLERQCAVGLVKQLRKRYGKLKLTGDMFKRLSSIVYNVNSSIAVSLLIFIRRIKYDKFI